MSDLMSKLFNNLHLMAILLGIVAFIAGAADQLSVGSLLIKISDPTSRLILEAFGILAGSIGLIFLAVELIKNYQPNALSVLGTADAKKLYTFSGYNGTRDDDTFQDFEMSRDKQEGNINAVYYLWADTLEGSQIHALVDKNDNFLRISFTSSPKSWASNIAIRSKNEKALHNRYSRPYLAFEARTSLDAPDNYLSEVCIAIRIVNGSLQHWKYIHGDNHPIMSLVTSSKWQTFFIDLNPCNWSLFMSDGNRLFGDKNANFDIISSVVFELGSNGAAGLGPGAGSIDIRRIRLTNERG